MGKPEIGRVKSVVKDPMLSDMFQLKFPEVPIGSDAEEPLLIHCQQATKPGITINNVELQLFGHTIEHAGNATFSHDMSIQFVENSRGQVQRILERWAEYVKSHKTQHGHYKDEYSRNGILEIFDQAGNLVLQYKINGMWPSQVPEVQFDGSNSSLITLGATFKYDDYEKVGGSSA